jgi:hypothetical protein
VYSVNLPNDGEFAPRPDTSFLKSCFWYFLQIAIVQMVIITYYEDHDIPQTLTSMGKDQEYGVEGTVQMSAKNACQTSATR